MGPLYHQMYLRSSTSCNSSLSVRVAPVSIPFRCRGLILLESYTVDSSTEFVDKLPSFLNVLREVTGDPQYSMYNLALKDEGNIFRLVASENIVCGLSNVH